MCDEKEDRKRDKGWQEKVLIYLFLSEGSFLQETVCGAVLMAGAAKDVAGKVWAIFFPIFAFVVSGYEHCVANMYYIPAGIFAKQNPEYVQTAMEQYGYTTEQLAQLNWKTFFINSSIPVTLGNVIGGMVFMGALLYLVYKREKTK